MRKQDIEKARSTYFNTGVNTSALKAKISQDLDIVRSAHDIAAQALDQISYLLHNIPHEDKPTRAMRDLAGALRDVSNTLVMLREEGRETIRIAVGEASQTASQGPTALPEHEEHEGSDSVPQVPPVAG